MFAPSVCFPKMITCMGVTVTCANETPSVVLPNITVLPLSSKLNIWKCLTLLLQKDANPQDNKEKVMKTREKERIQKPQVLMLQHRNQGKSFKSGFAFRLVGLPGSLELSAASPALKLKHKCLSVQMAKASACRTKIISHPVFSVQRWRVSLLSPTQSILHHLLSLLATAKQSWGFKGHDFCTWVSRQGLKNYHQHKQSFKSVLKGASWEVQGNEGIKQDSAGVWKLRWWTNHNPPEMRKVTQDTPSAVRTGDAWNTLWFFREGNKCKTLEDGREEAHVKTWEKSSIPRILPELSRRYWADGLSSMQCLKQGQRPFPVMDPQSDEWPSINAINSKRWRCILK